MIDEYADVYDVRQVEIYFHIKLLTYRKKIEGKEVKKFRWVILTRVERQKIASLTTIIITTTTTITATTTTYKN